MLVPTAAETCVVGKRDYLGPEQRVYVNHILKRDSFVLGANMKAVLTRLLRFRLRTLLVVVTLCCLYLGLVVRKAEQQKEGVAWIKQSIGSSAEIVYDYELTGTATRNVAAIPPGPD